MAHDHILTSREKTILVKKMLKNEINFDRFVENQEKEKDLVHVMFLEIPVP
jgi:hypothetical protein